MYGSRQRTKRETLKTRFLKAIVLALCFGLLNGSANADYRQKAEYATDYIQSHFYDSAAHRYRPSYPADPKALPYELMWGNGVQFTVLAAAAHADPAKYKPVLADFADGLQGYWDPTAPVPAYNAYCSGPGGTDKYYDDNEWMVLGFTEAYQNTGDARYLQLARDTQRFVLSGWDDALGGGIYWKVDRKTKNTCSNAPAAAAALRLAQVGGPEDAGQVAWADKIKDWTDRTLEDSDGLYWDNINLSGKMSYTKYTYNTALMVRTDVLLFQLRHDPADLAAARRSADAGLAAWTDPATGSLQKTEGSPRFTHLFCEALLRLYDATHDVRYLNAVRREASFASRYVRDPAGGYRDDWTTAPPQPGARKALIESASAARLFWLLAPYPDVDQLDAASAQAKKQGHLALAKSLSQQALDSEVILPAASH